MREIIFDTETTGLDPMAGHRLVEIGCVELLNYIPTGQTFHVYLDPQRDMPAEAFAVHGLSREFLTGKPTFDLIAADFMAFIGDARLIAHNAEFDMRFVNSELVRAGLPTLAMDRVIDTLALARRKHPGAPNSLDALCSRYRIDNARRTKHGALLDAEILAEVYAELCGGRQTTLVLAERTDRAQVSITSLVRGARPVDLPSTVAAHERVAHADFIESMGDKAIWNSFAPKVAEAPKEEELAAAAAG